MFSLDFELPENPLYKGEVTKRVVSNDVLEQEKPTVVCLFQEHGRLNVVTYVLDDAGKPQMVLGGEASILGRGADLVGAYRAFRITEGLRRADDDACLAALLAPYMATMVSESERNKTKASLLKQFDEQTLAGLLKVLPDDLVLKLLHLRNDLGMPLDTTFVTDELDAGRLEYSAELQGLNVEHPSNRRKRVDRFKAVADCVGPTIVEYLRREGHDMAHDSKTPCTCKESFEKTAYVAVCKKLLKRESPLLAGISILAYFGMKLIQQHLARSMHDFYVSPMGRQQCLKIAEFLCDRNVVPGSRDAKSVAQELNSIMLRWDAAETDETVS